MKQPQVMFPIPCFIEPVDLEKIKFKESGNYEKSFLSNVSTTLGKDSFTDESYSYICGIISECICQFSNEPFYIGQVWRNNYKKTDWQDPHIHSGAQWSFVIYDTVESSKTVFMSPARKEIMNQWGMYANTIPMDFIPNVPPGHIIIFPSWVEHFVMSGNEGVTISGNVYLTEPPKGPV